ncbi:MAG TPA: hypothetical protein VEI97_04855 [bacterium]|nr:hypothetical protein [bacterium]
MATPEELTKELQETKHLLEVERQKVRKLEQEIERLQRKVSGGLPAVGPALGTLGATMAPLADPTPRTPFPLTQPPTAVTMPTPAARPSIPEVATATVAAEPPIGGGGDEGSDADLAEIRRQLEDVTREKHEVEQRKWTIDKENIALKEQLNKLKVQGQNSQKIIEELVEKLDRKENQNFKTRLELTDLRKDIKLKQDQRHKQEEINAKLKLEIAETEAELLHYKQLVEQEQARKDIIQSELNEAQDVLGQYQTGFLARFYDK